MNNRSENYQWKICELSVDPQGYNYKNTQLDEQLKPEVKDKLYDLYDELNKEYWRFMKEVLSPKNYKIAQLMAEGYTQVEIAKMYNTGQSTIKGRMIGSIVKTKKYGKRRHGGFMHKLREVVKGDYKINLIKQEIMNLLET